MRKHEALPDHGYLEPESGVRFGMALVVDAETETPRLALFEWRIANLAVVDNDGQIIVSKALNQSWEELVTGEQQTQEGGLAPGWIRFSLLGSERFQQLAGMPILYPDIWNDPGEETIWDPGGYVDTAPDFPTNAPSRTVAASIERNLLYAASEAKRDQRLDVIFASQMVNLEALIDSHRFAQKTTIDVAFSSLLSDWQQASTNEKDRSEQ